MPSISFRRLLSKLTALALSTSAAAASAAPLEPSAPVPLSFPGDLDGDELDASLDLDLSDWREQLDPADAAATLGRGLAMALAGLRPLEALHVASTWGLSHDAVRRLAVAHALEWVFPLVGAGTVIDHLARDPDPAIRVVAARAAWVRRTTGGDPGVLARLVEDPDPAVREIARAVHP
ncbi:MAG: hypothetical protein NT062_19905 [Proteobacteria bacterium]|nr:hypothetical protein [Pseudomonadota bacterium]